MYALLPHIDVFELMQVLQREMMFLNEKRKRANPCGERRRMDERQQMKRINYFS